MFRNLKWLFSFFLFLIIFTLLNWLLFSFINLVFELISCRFKPWFPKERPMLFERELLQDLYYFFGFFDYAAVCLPEFVNLGTELKNLDENFYNTVVFFSYIYAIIINDLFSILCQIFEFKFDNKDVMLPQILKSIGLDFFELNSFFAYYTDVIILDTEDGLDKYFLNISSQGWFRDAWEIKGPQIEYLKTLATKNYLTHDFMSTTLYQDESISSFLKSFDNLYLKRQEWNPKKRDLNSYMLLHNKFEFEEFKFDNLLRFTQSNLVNFSLFYKLVMNADRFFFDSLYLYFFFQENGVMFRVNRNALMEIFSSNIIWGLLDYNRYPFNFAWDYNYYGMMDFVFMRNNCFGLKSPELNHSFEKAIPFSLILNERDIFLYNNNWINLAIFDDLDDRMISNDGIFEWNVNISEFKPEIWGDYTDYEFWKQSLVFRAQHGPDHSLEPITYDSNLIEEDYLEIKRRQVRLIKERTIKSRDNMRHKYLKKGKSMFGVFTEEVEEDPLKGVFFIKSSDDNK